MSDDKWVRVSDNIFDDLGFNTEEAAVLKIKADLMIEIEKAMVAEKLNQTTAAQVFGIPRPRLNRMLKGDLNGVSIDKMVRMVDRTGRNVKVSVARKRRKAAA
jgi:predicted XRE-type DNA-binding protein